MELLSSYIIYEVDILLWKPITVSKNEPLLSHLFFADNLMLIARADNNSIYTMAKCMNIFSRMSGQRINSIKSKVIFSKFVSSNAKLLIKQTFQYFPGYSLWRVPWVPHSK